VIIYSKPTRRLLRGGAELCLAVDQVDAQANFYLTPQDGNGPLIRETSAASNFVTSPRLFHGTASYSKKFSWQDSCPLGIPDMRIVLPDLDFVPANQMAALVLVSARTFYTATVYR